LLLLVALSFIIDFGAPRWFHHFSCLSERLRTSTASFGGFVFKTQTPKIPNEETKRTKNKFFRSLITPFLL
jgi:hypothetical protein